LPNRQIKDESPGDRKFIVVVNEHFFSEKILQILKTKTESLLEYGPLDYEIKIVFVFLIAAKNL